MRLGGLDPTAHDQRSSCGYDHTIYVEGADSVTYYSAEPPPPSSPYLVPAGGGTITSWSVSQLQTGDQIRLAIVSFGPGARSLVVDAESPVETISSQQDRATVTYPVHIRVRAGEEIGLDVWGSAEFDCEYPGTYGEDVYLADDGQSGTHSFGTLGPESSSLVNLQATLQPGASSGSRRHHRRRHHRRRHHRRHRRRTAARPRAQPSG